MISRELIAASTEPLVLSLLQRGENYGYAIAEKVRLFSKGEMELGPKACSIPFCIVSKGAAF